MKNPRDKRVSRKSGRRTGLAVGVLSCCAALPAAVGQTNQAPAAVEVPIKVRNGDLLVETRAKGSEPLWFKLDTGFGITILHPDLVGKLNLSPAGHLTINGIAGNEQADAYKGAVFEFGGMTYSPRRVAVLDSEAHRRWRRRDGILDAGFFRKFVVEIDTVRGLILLREPARFDYAGKGEVLPLEFRGSTPIMEATIVPPGRAPIPGRFEIDTGCDDCVCLGHDFVSANGLIEETNTLPESVRRGVGGSVDIQPGRLAELRLGTNVVQKPTANFFLAGSPAGDGLAGHIGLGALEHFRMIFDYSRRRLILETEK